MFGRPNTVEVPISGLGKLKAYYERNRLVHLPGVNKASLSLDDNGWTGRVVLYVEEDSRERVEGCLIRDGLLYSRN